MKKIIIVGAGSCGLVCAMTLGRYICENDLDAMIMLIEHKEKIGKKLLATGNGRCNMSNKQMDLKHYEGHHLEKIESLLFDFDIQEFFERIGLWTKYMGNLLYPQSEQAKSVLGCIEAQLIKYQIDIHLLEKVEEIKKKGKFMVKTSQNSYQADYVVLATGGDAASQFGSDGSGFQLLKTCGHHLYPSYPSLVQLKCQDMDSTLKGVRIHGTFTLYSNGNEIAKEKGEILFTEDGLSGISILQLSRYYPLYKDTLLEVGVDVMDEYSSEELTKKLLTFIHYDNEILLEGIVNQKYAKYLEKYIPREYIYKRIKEVVCLLKDHRFIIIGSRQKKDAQVCMGGADLLEFKETLESVHIENLYAGGEVLDVAGDCGGYNLHFAFSCGKTIADDIYTKLLMGEIKC